MHFRTKQMVLLMAHRLLYCTIVLQYLNFKLSKLNHYKRVPSQTELTDCVRVSIQSVPSKFYFIFSFFHLFQNFHGLDSFIWQNALFLTVRMNKVLINFTIVYSGTTSIILTMTNLSFQSIITFIKLLPIVISLYESTKIDFSLIKRNCIEKLSICVCRTFQSINYAYLHLKYFILIKKYFRFVLCQKLK